MSTTAGMSIITIIATVLAVAATGDARSGEDATAGAPAEAKPAKKKRAEPPAIDPDAIAALAKMGAFLRNQQSFTVRTTTETDFVLDSGQKVRLSARGELRVRRPDHFQAHVVSDRKERKVFYDGKTFTIFAPQVGYYATVAAPPTILELADLLVDKHGLELPLVDLFRWGSDELDTAELTSAAFIGTARIDGTLTDHYAFRQPGVDWQIWIQHGAQALPRKLVLTTTDDPARPEHAVEMTWTLGATHEDAVFAFAPPADASEIQLAELPKKPDEPRRAKRSARR